MKPDWNIIVSVLAAFSPILALLVAGLGWLYRHERERRDLAEQQVSEHKYRAYIKLLDAFFDAMKMGKFGNKQPDPNDPALIERMVDINKDLVLYGSDEIVRAYQDWLAQTRREGKADLRSFGRLVVLIRRDMGHPRTKMTEDGVLRQFITDYDEAKAKGLI